MRRLIYISRSLIGPGAGEIEAIIAISTARNSAVGITGMLWVGDGHFAQVLEGVDEHVGETMDRIGNDSRHAEIEVLLDREVSTRQFGTWSMRQADDGEATAFMIGFALGHGTASSQRLYEIVLASIGHDARSS
jgi:hypothetical protein